MPQCSACSCLTLVALSCALAACSKDDSNPVAPRIIPTVHELDIVPTTATLRVGETLIMTVHIRADSGADRTVLWSSADPRRATVSPTGIVTAVSEGPVVITASAKARPELAKSAALSITPGRTVRTLRATPENVTLQIGETQQVAVNVTADEGVDRSVTYTSNNPTVATADAAGLITAVAAGAAAIRVATVVDTTLFVSIGVTVRAPTPPQISIQSITQGSRQTPVNTSNVAGQLDVTLNVEPGSEPLARVDLVVSQQGKPDTVVASHGFSTSSAIVSADRRVPNETWPEAALRTIAAAQAVVPVLLSFRTEAYAPTTGAVAFRNGAITLGAVAVTLGRAGSTVHRATVNTPMMLNNLDGFHVAITNLTSTGRPSATDARGLSWVQAGKGLVVTSVPVLYSGRTLATRSISFPGASPVATQVSTKVGIAVDTIPLGAYELDAAGPSYFSGERPAIAAADVTGQPLRLVGTANSDGAGILNAQPNAEVQDFLFGLRVDNVPPPPGASFIISTQFSSSENWVGKAYLFSSGLAGIVADKGVGLTGSNSAPTATTVNAQYRAIGGVITDTLLVTQGVDLPPSVANTTYQVLARYRDRLANVRDVPLSATPTNPLATFGVDTLAPGVRYLTAPLAGQAVITKFSDSVYTSLTFGGGTLVYGIEAIDDRSGLDGAPAFVTVTHFGPPGATTCIIGSLVNGVCTPNAAAFQATAIDGYRIHTTVMDGGHGVEGYYNYRAYIRDRAGNSSQIITKAALYDVGAGTSGPQLATISYPALMRGGQPVAFAPVAADNVELVRGHLYLTYPNLPVTPTIAYENGGANGFVIGTAFDATLSTVIAGHAGFTVPQFIRALEVTNGFHAPQPYTAGTVKPTAVNGVVRDVPNVTPATLASSVPIPPNAVESATGPTPGFANLTGLNKLSFWRPFTAAFNPLRFEAVGPSGQTQSPFARVILTRVSPGLTPSGQVWRVVTEVTSASGFDNGLERIWQYSFGNQPNGSYVAIGVTAQGDAIASQVVVF